MTSFRDTLANLSSAEDFFSVLGVPYDEAVVRVNRLHILKRFNDYLRAEQQALEDADDATAKAVHATCLARAHADFVTSDAVTEGVFKVFKQARGQGFVSLDQIEPPPT